MIIDDEDNIFNYTNKQRLRMTKRLKYQKLNENYRSKTGIKNLEMKLTGYNSKSCIFENLKKYIKRKNKVAEIIRRKQFDFGYLKKLKWYSYMNNQKADAELLNMIEKKYGKDLVIIIGDWSIGKQMRNFISTPNLRLKRLLAKKYEVYNIDEFRTSCLHYKTEERVENLYLPDKKKKMREMHAILTYKTGNCKGCINRDKNGVNNIRKLAREFLSTGRRPENYTRQKKTSTEQTVTELVRGEPVKCSQAQQGTFAVQKETTNNEPQVENIKNKPQLENVHKEKTKEGTTNKCLPQKFKNNVKCKKNERAVIEHKKNKKTVIKNKNKSKMKKSTQCELSHYTSNTL